MHYLNWTARHMSRLLTNLRLLIFTHHPALFLDDGRLIRQTSSSFAPVLAGMGKGVQTLLASHP